MSGYCDYMLLLRPDEPVNARIAYYKAFAEGLIGNYPSARSTAHISIAQYIRRKPFVMRPAIDDLHPRLRTMKAVTLQINNFNFFVHKNDTFTIYAAIEPTYRGDNWFNTLAQHLHVNRKSFIPHLTIARAINENAFYKLWPQFKYMVFRQPFVIDNLTVLERETLNSYSKWSIYHEFKFESEAESDLKRVAY